MLEDWNSFKAGVSAVWGIFVSIITAPTWIAAWINKNLGEVMPEFLQWEIGSTAAPLIGLIITGLWARHWSKVAGPAGNIAKIVPFVGGFLGIAVPVYMYYMLFSGCRAIAGSGWLQALVFLLASVAFCAPGYNKWIILALQRTGSVGRWILTKFGQGGKLVGGKIADTQWSDPIKKATLETMENLYYECGENDVRFIARSEHIKDLLVDKHRESKGAIEKTIEEFKKDKGIMLIESRTISSVVERGMTFEVK